MTVKPLTLYLDADVYKRLALALRERGYDVISAVEVGRRENEDWEQLTFAISEGRAVLSFNRGHFVQLHTRYMERGWEHFGIIVSDQYGLGEILRRTLNLLETLSADDMVNRLEYLSSWG